MHTKRAGQFEVKAFTDGWPIRVCIRDLKSSSNPCEQTELQMTLEDAHDLAHCLARIIHLTHP